MKRDGHQQGSTATLRICNCKAPWSSSGSSSSSAYPLRTDDLSWPLLPAAGGANPRVICLKCRRPRPGGASRRRSAAEHKSMGKGKGERKVRSCDVALNHRLVSWRVVDRGVDGMVRAGVSASGIVGYLAGLHREDYDDDGEYDEEMEDGPLAASDYTGEVEMGCGAGDVAEVGAQEEVAMLIVETEDGGGGIGFEEADDDMGFYQVGFVWDYVDEEDWCVVGEL